MKLKRLASIALIMGASSIIIMGASGGCGSDLYKGAVAADSIGSSLNSAAAINHQLIASGQESAAEGATVANYIDAAAKANDTFVAQISSAETSGAQVNSATIVSAFGALTATLQSLQSQGVLGLKNPAAQTAFQAVMASINTELAVLKGLVQANSAGLKHSAPLMGLALTAEEIETIIGALTAIVPTATELIEKLLAMKGETDSQLLSDATSQDALAEKQAEADEEGEEQKD